MTSERLSGTWNRSLVAGAKPIHFLVSHLIEGSMILAIQFIEYLIYLVFFLTPAPLTVNATVLLSTLLLLNGITGLTFGLLLSIAMKTTMTAFAAAQFLVFPVTYVSGKLQIKHDRGTFLNMSLLTSSRQELCGLSKLCLFTSNTSATCFPSLFPRLPLEIFWQRIQKSSIQQFT